MLREGSRHGKGQRSRKESFFSGIEGYIYRERYVLYMAGRHESGMGEGRHRDRERHTRLSFSLCRRDRLASSHLSMPTSLLLPAPACHACPVLVSIFFLLSEGEKRQRVLLV